jgi:hypothetical protein
MGWNIEKRLSYMEKHWSYFIGFGKETNFQC